MSKFEEVKDFINKRSMENPFEESTILLILVIILACLLEWHNTDIETMVQSIKEDL